MTTQQDVGSDSRNIAEDSSAQSYSDHKKPLVASLDDQDRP
jgi:hypothetical protein